MPSAGGPRSYRRALLFPAALLLLAAHKPPRPSGELLLDAANPVIAVTIEGVSMRLRVDLDRQNSIELNPAAAARLTAKWEDGMDLDVGRVRLTSRIAPAILIVQGRKVQTQVSDHGRDCCVGADGAIGPDLLPFATVLWHRSDAPTPNGRKIYPLDQSQSTGLSAAAAVSGVRLGFSLTRPQTLATAAAGGRLVHLWGGHWDGEQTRATVAFGVARPVRAIAFARPGTLAGFGFDDVIVRLSDFGGDDPLPADPVPAGDIVVAHRLARQHVWPAVVIGADRLRRCAEIRYTAIPRTLTLACAFDQP